jgi:membrane-bound serine protease (ClpP class)
MRKIVWWVLPILVMLLLAFGSASAQPDEALVLLLTMDAPVAPPMVVYLERGLQLAEQKNADLLILQLDTPGGSVDAMNEMVQLIRASKVPVAVYVSPRGSMAASAGTVVVLAGHVAAMAPETTIGAASPVGSQGEDLGETMEAKTVNILKATVRALAKDRPPKAIELAEKTIESAEAVSANEALEAGLVDYLAVDVDDLLNQVDGSKLRIDSREITLQTHARRVEPISPSFIESLLAVLTNPSIVFLLLTIGVQSILIEISSPGGWAAGTIGAVCLALAAYGLGVLPVNWFGIVFFLIAFVLFILDIKAPTHGALTTAGVISLIIAALVMFNSPGLPNFLRVPVPLIIGVSASTGAFFFVIMIIALRAQKRPIRMGTTILMGKTGTARGEIAPSGFVQLEGEQWSAELMDGEDAIHDGERVEVLRVDGLRLIIRRWQK